MTRIIGACLVFVVLAGVGAMWFVSQMAATLSAKGFPL